MFEHEFRDVPVSRYAEYIHGCELLDSRVELERGYGLELDTVVAREELDVDDRYHVGFFTIAHCESGLL